MIEEHPLQHEFVDRRGRRARVATVMLHDEVWCDIGFVDESFDLEETETTVSLCYDHEDGTYVALDEWDRESWLAEHKPALVEEFKRRLKAAHDAEIAQRVAAAISGERR